MCDNNHIKCPFCSQSPSVGYFYKHIFRCHLPELFDAQTDWGKRNLQWLNHPKVRTSLYTVYLPKNESKYCCLECEKACNKLCYAEPHKKCLAKSFEKQETIRATLNIEPTNAPFCDPPDHSDKSSLNEYRERLYQKIIYNLYVDLDDKQEWAYWFNKLMEDKEIHKRFTELREMGEMPDDEKYNPATEHARHLRLLGLSWETIKQNDRKKLPTPPN